MHSLLTVHKMKGLGMTMYMFLFWYYENSFS